MLFLGKYYLVDAGYAVDDGYMGPFRKRELQNNEAFINFNHHHVRLRSVVERTFGVVKKRFEILKDMPKYPRDLQSKIVLGCCGLHNYLRDRTLEIDALMNPEDIARDYNGSLEGSGIVDIRRWIASNIKDIN